MSTEQLDPLICDAYAGDFDGQPNVDALIKAGYPWCGLILKATEGTYYPRGSAQKQWFLDFWQKTRVDAGARYGQDWFRGAYHYARIDEDPTLQAKWYLSLVEEAGGFGEGDLWPMVDVESAENPPYPGAAEIEDWVKTYVGVIYSELGRATMLYGQSYLADNRVSSTMNCGALTVARYASSLPPSTYQGIGWTWSDLPTVAMPTLWGWQYSGNPDGGSLAGYPTVSPLGPGNCDITAVIAAGGKQAGLEWTRANLGSMPSIG